MTPDDDVIQGRGQIRIPPGIPEAKSSVIGRAVLTHRPYTDAPVNPETKIEAARSVNELRDFLRLLEFRQQLDAAEGKETRNAPFERAKQVTISGTLFPCGLLSAGWWQHATPTQKPKIPWRSKIQEWHFVGFNEWVPSWDFTWDFDRASPAEKPYFAQFGDGDEADSLPVFMTGKHAKIVHDERQPWGGLYATITCLLAHRSHFPALQQQEELRDVGGWLNYCLWIDPNNPKHGIEPGIAEPDLYSGYLWKCLAPREWVESRPLTVLDVFFIWTHTDFLKPEVVAFGRELLEAKEELLRRHVSDIGASDLVMLAKSSPHVSGTQVWGREEFFRLLDLKRVPPSGPR